MSKLNSTFPRADVNPEDKRKIDWLRRYAKAAFNDSETSASEMFRKAAPKWQENRDYALCRQTTDRYKPILGVDEGDDESWASVDWSVRKIVTKFRDIAINKVLLREFKIVCAPIDPMAKSELDEMYAADKAWIMMKQQAIATGNPDIINSPALMPKTGQPISMEELEMKMKYGAKLNVAIEAEQGVEFVFDYTGFPVYRRTAVEDEHDFGVGGYKEWLDENGMPDGRAVDVRNVVINNCRKRNFKDATHIGEVTEVPFTELSKYFTPVEMEEMAGKCANQYGNPRYIASNSDFNQAYDGFKALVLDLEIKSDDTIVYEKRVDRRGNVKTKRGKFEKRNSKSTIEIDGTTVKKFYPRTIENLYRVKWVIGTDFCYDYGLAFDIKREPIKKFAGRTTFSYHLISYAFDGMRCLSFMDRLRPLIDDYHVTHYKLQNLKNRMVSSGWAIDLDALESVTLQKGGEEMTAKQVLDLFFTTGILVYRGSTIDNTNPNRKPVEALTNSFAAELVELRNELARIVQDMRDVTGLNEVTDGSTPSDRMLNGVAGLANSSTNNALYSLMEADKLLTESYAKGIVQRLQQAVKRGDVEGVIKGLGADAVRHIKVTRDIAPHIWGITFKYKPTDEERQQILQQLNLKDANGQVDPEDICMAYNIDDTKELREYLAYRAKQRMKDAQAAAAANTQMTTKSQQDSAQFTSQLKIQELQVEWKLRTDYLNKQKEWDMKLLETKMSMQGDLDANKHAAGLTSDIISAGSQQAAATGGEGGEEGGDDFSEVPMEDENASLEDVAASQQPMQ